MEAKMVNIATTTRTHALKRHVQELCDAGVRKTTFYPLIAQSLKATIGEPRQIRRAKAFEHLMDNVGLAVLPFEVLGGSIIGMWPLTEEAPLDGQRGFAFAAVEKYINQNEADDGAEPKGISFEARVKRRLSRFALMARDHYNANIRYETMQQLIREVQKAYEGSDKIKPHMIAKILEDEFVFDYGEEEMGLIDGLPWISANHVHLNYGMVINTGYGALLAKTEGLLAKSADAGDAAKTEFYTAVKITLEAVIRYIKRYANVYRDAATAAVESGGDRTAEESGGDRAAEESEIGRAHV
jgi:formate C-acetyltransferase